MKYGLLVTRPISDTKNIGDYIQSLAAKQFLPSGNYCYIDKETISQFSSEEETKVIMNAWYMWHPENWPPQLCVYPLLTSIHITPLTANEMLSDDGKKYLKEHGPVGCRDTGTRDILEEAGVPCFFSGCLTLTLGGSYRYTGEREGTIFVDPFIPSFRYKINRKKTEYNPTVILKSIIGFFASPIIISNIYKNKYFSVNGMLRGLLKASLFYYIYSSKFSDEMLLKSEYIHHIIPVNTKDDDEVLMKKAERLVKKYARAKFVVTSRIHCALPSIGLDTPVIFVLSQEMESKEEKFNAPNRFGGLIDFFRVMCIHKNTLVTRDQVLSKFDRLTSNSTFSNKTNWISYRDALVSQCKKFIDNRNA